LTTPTLTEFARTSGRGSCELCHLDCRSEIEDAWLKSNIKATIIHRWLLEHKQADVAAYKIRKHFDSGHHLTTAVTA
jgi:hypothetical protein